MEVPLPFSNQTKHFIIHRHSTSSRQGCTLLILVYHQSSAPKAPFTSTGLRESAPSTTKPPAPSPTSSAASATSNALSTAPVATAAAAPTTAPAAESGCVHGTTMRRSSAQQQSSNRDGQMSMTLHGRPSMQEGASAGSWAASTYRAEVVGLEHRVIHLILGASVLGFLRGTHIYLVAQVHEDQKPTSGIDRH